VISPLLANIYMNRFLKYWRGNDLGRRLAGHVVTYADDLVILTRGHAGEALQVLRHMMGRIGLTVNEAKTSLRAARTERFDLLGYSFGPHWGAKVRRT
jgi:RNA-directed DNA polymerase